MIDLLIINWAGIIITVGCYKEIEFNSGPFNSQFDLLNSEWFGEFNKLKQIEIKLRPEWT